MKETGLENLKAENLKVAIVHDWLVRKGGAENVLEVLCEMFPTADIFTVFYRDDAVPESLANRRIYTSFLQKWPGIGRYYQYLLPLMPIAVEQFDFSGYDMVISSSWACAKGVVVPVGVRHVCYLYTPMRYMWDLHELYFGDEAPGWKVKKVLMRKVMHFLRMWDVASGRRPDKVVAVSEFVARRARKVYGIECDVVYPSVDVERFEKVRERREMFLEGKSAGREDYYLMITTFETNKQVDVVVREFNESGKKLKVVGSGGRMEKRVKRMAGNNIEFLGRLTDEDVDNLLVGAMALVHMGIEDFGIVPLEAMIAGVPVIGEGEGGWREVDKSMHSVFERKLAHVIGNAYNINVSKGKYVE